ncbi:hypothetical protein [Duganella flavida]|uniref:hypothetical protein n=1 Tax=Duganella flavida TaxID=2692175 RepID=UPI0019281AFC|nr:hypothetical protein [Duganella flavida]
MDHITFQQNFPPATDIPVLLCKLLEFQNKATDWYSGYFELDKWKFGNPAWFGESSTAEQFAVFGCGPDGSLYALWLYPGRTLDDAPVVFLGSEGTDCNLIAGDLRQFLELLALGADELGFEINWGEIQIGNEEAPRLAEFRDWLWSSFQIRKPSNPIAAVLESRTHHPDFEKWMAIWQEART